MSSGAYNRGDVIMPFFLAVLVLLSVASFVWVVFRSEPAWWEFLETRGAIAHDTRAGFHAAHFSRNTEGTKQAVSINRSYPEDLLGKHIVEHDSRVMQYQVGRDVGINHPRFSS